MKLSWGIEMTGERYDTDAKVVHYDLHISRWRMRYVRALLVELGKIARGR